MDHPDPDPAAQAAADVERLLSTAPGLQRIVEVARAVDGDHLGAASPEPGAPGEDPRPVEGTSNGRVDGKDGA